MLKEFKDFIMRGNVIDLAVGIVIGAAFTAIVSSLVDDIIMPPIGLLLGAVDFSQLFVTLSEGTIPGPYTTIESAQEAGAVTWNVGLFINAIIKFLIVAAAVFLIVKGFNSARRKQEEAPEEAPAKPREEVLLEEIRDIMARQSGGRDPAKVAEENRSI